jgi:hypothetical protein
VEEGHARGVYGTTKESNMTSFGTKERYKYD